VFDSNHNPKHTVVELGADRQIDRLTNGRIAALFDAPYIP